MAETLLSVIVSLRPPWIVTVPADPVAELDEVLEHPFDRLDDLLVEDADDVDGHSGRARADVVEGHARIGVAQCRLRCLGGIVGSNNRRCRPIARSDGNPPFFEGRSALVGLIKSDCTAQRHGKAPFFRVCRKLGGLHLLRRARGHGLGQIGAAMIEGMGGHRFAAEGGTPPKRRALIPSPLRRDIVENSTPSLAPKPCLRQHNRFQGRKIFPVRMGSGVWGRCTQKNRLAGLAGALAIGAGKGRGQGGGAYPSGGSNAARSAA